VEIGGEEEVLKAAQLGAYTQVCKPNEVSCWDSRNLDLCFLGGDRAHTTPQISKTFCQARLHLHCLRAISLPAPIFFIPDIQLDIPDLMNRMSSGVTRSQVALGAAAFLTLMALLHQRNAPTIGPALHRAATRSSSEHLTCKLRHYVSSAWEGEWLTNADDLAAKEAMCPTMRASADLAAQWLAGVAACKQDAAACWPALPDRVFSKFVKECWSTVGPSGLRIGGGRSMLVEERIEPLVGHMRHPYGLPACTPSGVAGVSVQDRAYLMLMGDDAAATRARYPGRAILLDAGTNKYESSLGYLIPAYARLGIHFDAVYAWEARPANGTAYWASVPADVKPHLHFYNDRVTPEPGSAMNPVDWIRDMHRPGDYIVFKLDIDNDVVESKLIQQVLALDNAGDIIAEMFFEKHYSAADMKPYFGSPGTKYPAALRLMHELRTKGVRAHFWP